MLSYFILRITASPFLDWDEAEQYINSRNFNLGDTQQPPLYSWITRILSIITNDSIYALISVRYICLYIFIIFLYLSIRQFFTSKKSLILTLLILALIPAYAYTINFKLTHSVLVFAMSSMTFYFYIKVLKKNSLLNFLLLGISVGLGLISKYNFSFLLSALILASLCSKAARKAFLRPQIVISIFSSLAIALPHYLWLYKNSESAGNYLKERGAFKLAVNTDYNYLLNFFSLSFSAFSQMLIFTAFLLSLYFIGKFKKIGTLSTKSTYSESKLRLLSYISLFSYLIPVIIFLLCKSNKLLSGWLSVSHFVTAILMYMLFHKFSHLRFYKLSYRIALASIIVLFFIKYLWIFHPNIFSKVNTININYTAVINKLEKLNLEDKEIICDNQMIYANLKILKPEWSLSYFKNKQERAKTKKQISDLKKQEIKAPYLHNKSHQNKNTTILFFLHNKLK
ncbi:MAG: glycosyltransferase family 39 protein [Cyanobacteria bacterium REEB446]|nr:glycosyltransferase family 39 protein [Cyanobacteria bacterium REEB446]